MPSQSHDEEAQVYAWNWFALHSAQRMQLVNFWLVAIAFLGAAFVQARSANLTAIAIGVCAAGATSSGAFLLLDARTRRLVQVAEIALNALEDKRVSAGADPATRLIHESHSARMGQFLSYRYIIEGLQITIGLLFIAGGFYSVAV